MRNVLYVKLSETAAVAIPGRNLRFVLATSATNVEVSYIGNDGGIGTFDLTVTSGKADEVIKALCQMSGEGTGLIHVGDQIAGTFGCNCCSSSSSERLIEFLINK